MRDEGKAPLFIYEAIYPSQLRNHIIKGIQTNGSATRTQAQEITRLA